MNNSFPKFCFFGTPHIAVWILDELEKAGMIPSFVVTNPDAPQGRKMIMTESPVGAWARERSIPTLKPHSLRGAEILETLKQSGCELFVVAAYGKLIPESILNIPKYQTINVHPSLLPKLRGASPIRSAILHNVFPTGVSIMVLTKGMDEGPIIAQEEAFIAREDWPLRGSTLDELLAKQGGALLAETLPRFISGEIVPREQNHTEATYCEKISKEMGEINLADDPHQNLLKIRAFDGWPGTYFFVEKNDTKIRVKIIDAELTDDKKLKITRVIPEGKKEMDYEDFLRG
jgi:methionyl-tRNA formyltransferase